MKARRRSAFPILHSIFLPFIFLPCPFGGAEEPRKPTFAAEVQGDWYVLLGSPTTQLGIEDQDAGLIGATLKIAADRLTLHVAAFARPRATDHALASVATKAEPLLAADCKALPGHEAEATLSGKLSGTRRIMWAVSSCGQLHIKLLTSDPVPRSRYLSNAWGDGPDTLYLALRRQPIPPRSPADAAADAKRILGTWTTAAHYDDAFLKDPGLQGKRTFSIVADRINELDDKGLPRRPPVGFWGPYRIAAPAGSLGGIDLQLESWAGGGAGLMGRTPSLYAFHGDDLLYLAYNETDRRPEEQRTRCERLRSDGNHNLFILERAP